MQHLAVLGGGSWATALVKILCNHDVKIHWWLRNPDTVSHVRQYGHNPNYLSDVSLNLDKVNPVSDLSTALNGAGCVILAIPAAFLQDALSGLDAQAFEGKTVFSAIKGIVPVHNLIVGDYMHTQFGVPISHIGVITGPCHAEEVALEKLSYLTVACQHPEHTRTMAGWLSCRYIRTVESDDIYGTEYAAVLKNVMALASGICHGLGYGDNFQAVLISNAIREIKRFVDAVHPIQRDINDSAYLGDLLVTAYSQFSRNRTFGSMIGKGYSVKSAQMEMNMVAEGYYAVACIEEMKKRMGLHLPISEAVYRILYQKKNARQEMQALTTQLS
jgi:glycerol-3-phosphate dehydrogenase (NAD(P)+)